MPMKVILGGLLSVIVTPILLLVIFFAWVLTHPVTLRDLVTPLSVTVCMAGLLLAANAWWLKRF